MINPRSISTLGIGFGVRAVATIGFIYILVPVGGRREFLRLISGIKRSMSLRSEI